MSERKLWCDHNPSVIQHRYQELLVGFSTHYDTEDSSISAISYTCNLDGIPVEFQLNLELFRKTKDGIFGDISRISIKMEDDTFKFVIPREWVWKTARKTLYRDSNVVPCSRDELLDKVISFLEDYL